MIPNQVLWDIVRQCPLLGCLGSIHGKVYEEDEEEHVRSPEYIRLDYEMSLNRARSRVVFRRDARISFPTALWSLVLSKAVSAFDKYQVCDKFCPCDKFGYYEPPTQADATFCLLSERGVKDIFIQQK
jgi:hypothetical protein